MIAALRDGGILVIARRARVPGQPARRRDHADGHAAVARGGRPGAARVRRDDQHDDARRPGDRDRRARRRCDHRRGERGAPPPGERGEAARRCASPRRSIVRDATLEIRTSIVFATVIIVLVFLPIFGLTGVEGRLLTPLAFAYIVALLASLAVAIVVTPALCFAFLPGAASIVRGHEGWLARSAESAVRARAAVRARSPGAGRPPCRSLLLAGGGAGDDALRHGVSSRVPRGQPHHQREHAARHLARQVGRDRHAASSRFCWRSRRSWRRRGAPDARSSTSTCRASRRRRSTSACANASARARSCSPSCGAASPACPARTSRSGSRSRTASITCCRARAPTSPSRSSATTSLTLRRLGERVREAMSGVAGVADLSLEQQTEIPFVRFVLNRPAIARYGLRIQDVADGDRDQLRRHDRRPRVRSRRPRSTWS